VRRLLPFLGVFVAGLVIGGGTIYVIDDSGGPDRVVASGTTMLTVVPSDSGATGPEEEFQRLLNAGRKLTFHARYAARVKEGTSADLELWNRPPDARRDVRAVTKEGRVHSAEIKTDQQLIRCVETEKTTWQCVPQAVASGGQDPGDLTLGAVKTLDGSTVEVREDRILNNTVKCFVITPPKDTNGLKQEVCLTAEGIPLKVDGGDGPATATVFEREVTDADFKPPVAPINTPG
jgi:hypothetical protein